MSENIKIPKWLYLVVFIFLVPLFLYPRLLASTSEEYKVLVWLYPFYVIGIGFLSLKCFAQRREITIILLILMLLSHIAVWYLK